MLVSMRRPGLLVAFVLSAAAALSPRALAAEPKVPPGESLDLHAEHLDLDLEKRSATMTGGVTISRGALELRCPRVEVRYDDAQNQSTGQLRVTWVKGTGRRRGDGEGRARRGARGRARCRRADDGVAAAACADPGRRLDHRRSRHRAARDREGLDDRREGQSAGRFGHRGAHARERSRCARGRGPRGRSRRRVRVVDATLGLDSPRRGRSACSGRAAPARAPSSARSPARSGSRAGGCSSSAPT